MQTLHDHFPRDPLEQQQGILQKGQYFFEHQQRLEQTKKKKPF